MNKWLLQWFYFGGNYSSLHNGGINITLLTIRHGWVITLHCLCGYDYLPMSLILMMLVKLIYVCKRRSPSCKTLCGRYSLILQLNYLLVGDNFVKMTLTGKYTAKQWDALLDRKQITTDLKTENYKQHQHLLECTVCKKTEGIQYSYSGLSTLWSENPGYQTQV